MEYKKQFARLSDKAKLILESSPRCHDWDHTLRVLNHARKLAALEGLRNLRVVELAAVLHDIARADEMAIKGKICHARQGAATAAALLVEAGVEAETIAKVVLCVRRHRYRGDDPPVSLEERIIYDADKLDSIGAIGIGRAFHFAGRIGSRVHNREDEALAGASYGVEDTAYREYLVKLRDIPGRLLTESGRRLAAEAAEFMERFFERLNQETYG